jgi:ABC-type bacteriocin/lantibiotic exporter with double-glycine peptidase domain
VQKGNRMATRYRIRQRDASDCGPACIASVMAYYGKLLPVSRIRQLARTDRKGTSMLGMVHALQQSGFEARGLRGTADHLHQLPLPFIAHVRMPGGLEHYVAVYRISRKKLCIMDPATGKMSRWSGQCFSSRWSGMLIAVAPGAGVFPEGAGTSNRERMLTLVRPVWKPLLQAFLSAVLYTILGLSTSFYLGKITDHVFVTRNHGLLNLMSLAMIGITLIMTYLSASRNLVMLKTGQVIDNQLIMSYYRHLLSLPQRFFDSMKTGEILSRINDAVKIRTFVNDMAIGILVNALILLFSFAAMFLIQPLLALIMLSIIPVYAGIYALFNFKNRKVERSVMERSASMEEQLVESLRSSAFIRQGNLGPLARERTERRLNRLLDTVFHSGINSLAAAAGTEILGRLSTVILLWTGSFFVIGDSMSPGNLLSFYALLGYITGPVGSLIGANKAFQNARIASDRLFEIFDLEGEQRPGNQHFRKSKFGDVELHGVSFSYGSRGEQIRDLDMVIPGSRITLLTGESGSGKSTVAALVRHLYPPDRGHITINGCDTRQYSLESIRDLMGVVPQQVFFLSGTILENIAPGIREPDLGRISGLLKDVGLDRMIRDLPDGLGSWLTGNAGNLSGGERQRLALVRALYRDPPLVILDEPTSSLDPASEKEVHRLLLALKEQEKTLLLITHKPRYASLADHVYIMESGRVRPEVCPGESLCL